MKKLVFFNFWQNGDCFINKEYIRDIISRFPEADLYYVHKNHPNIVADLGCKHATLDSLPRELTMWMPMASDPSTDTIYINTWVGCWIGKHIQHGEHANFTTLYRVWKDIYDALNIEMKPSYEDYHPEILSDYYNYEHALNYIKNLGSGPRMPLVVFCNGQAMSQQSSMGNMEKIIESVADAFPDHEFFVADRVDVDRPNVKFSEDVLRGTVGNLNQMSYISNFAKLIIGKNSGPFTYAHSRLNMNDPSATFMCFSHKMKDCLMGEGEYMANSFFSDTLDDAEATRIIHELISSPPYDAVKKPTRQL